MGSIVVYNPRSPDSNSSVGSGSGGGGVEDVLKRLGNVETHVSELRSQVSAILATLPHLATKADVGDVRAEVVALRADLSAGLGQAKADLAAAETAIIKWIVATVLASAALAFTIAKFVH
jgi:hypothetical protein